VTRRGLTRGANHAFDKRPANEEYEVPANKRNFLRFLRDVKGFCPVFYTGLSNSATVRCIIPDKQG